MPASPHQGTVRRIRRPDWRDPRLAVGVALVLASVVLGVLVVTGADDTVPVYAARRAIVPGEALDGSVSVVRVRLDDVDERYVTAARGLGPDDVALRSVGEGELLPLSAVGSAASVARRPVAVPLEGPVPEGLDRASLVDVWVADRVDEGDYGRPVKAFAAAEVAGVVEADGGLAALGTTAVEVLLDDAGTALLLEALADGDRVDVVVVPGSAGP